MPKKAKTQVAIKTTPEKPKSCGCEGECHDQHASLPGYLLIAFGLLFTVLNMGIIPGLEWAKAWPLFFVLFGVAWVVKVMLCRRC